MAPAMAPAAGRGRAHASLGREWITRAARRASAGLTRNGVNLTRLRRWGFESAARDAHVVARHDRRYSLELPFGGVKEQQQSGNCWLFAPLVLARAAALKRGSIAATQSFSETHLAPPPHVRHAGRMLTPTEYAERVGFRAGEALKYRVVNSWGPEMGDHGIYRMYAEWFEENVFKLAVQESVLDARERAAYDDPLPAPGGSFY
jgi:aminopeptidase C